MDYLSCTYMCSRRKIEFREHDSCHIRYLLAPQNLQHERRTCYVYTGTLKTGFSTGVQGPLATRHFVLRSWKFKRVQVSELSGLALLLQTFPPHLPHSRKPRYRSRYGYVSETPRPGHRSRGGGVRSQPRRAGTRSTTSPSRGTTATTPPSSPFLTRCSRLPSPARPQPVGRPQSPVKGGGVRIAAQCCAPGARADPPLPPHPHPARRKGGRESTGRSPVPGPLPYGTRLPPHPPPPREALPALRREGRSRGLPRPPGAEGAERGPGPAPAPPLRSHRPAPSQPIGLSAASTAPLAPPHPSHSGGPGPVAVLSAGRRGWGSAEAGGMSQVIPEQL